MKRIRNQKQNEGFTLIELLVVISIIALLFTIVLAGVQSARNKAKNTKLNEIAMQYVNAFALYTTDGTAFPQTESITSKYVCLGYGDDYCIDGARQGDDSPDGIESKIQTHYPDMPTYEEYEVEIMEGISVSGIMYKYTPTSGTDEISKKPQLEWYLEGSVECPLGADKEINDFPGKTRCIYYLDN